MNEKMCPELLEHHMEFVDVMLEQLKELEVMISQATSKTDIRVAAHLMEMDRIKYVISDYLRCRLKKVCITTNIAISVLQPFTSLSVLPPNAKVTQIPRMC